MFEPTLDVNTPEMRAARSEGKTLLMNLAAVGFAPVFFATHYSPPEPLGVGAWIVGFSGLYSFAASYFCLRTLVGIVHSIHRRMSYLWLVSAAILAALSGAGLGLAYRWLRLGELKALIQTYDAYAVVGALMAIGLLAIWIIVTLLVRLIVRWAIR